MATPCGSLSTIIVSSIIGATSQSAGFALDTSTSRHVQHKPLLFLVVSLASSRVSDSAVLNSSMCATISSKKLTSIAYCLGRRNKCFSIRSFNPSSPISISRASICVENSRSARLTPSSLDSR
jgi:hypothetical protein